MKGLRELIVLSLERWDDVWRRNQLLIEALVADRSDLRVLFAEPPLAALRSFHGVRPPRPDLRGAPELPAVTVLQPVEWTPDRLSPFVPPVSGAAVRRFARRLGLEAPVLWVNNHSLARFALSTRWPLVYDVTDDWLLAEQARGKRRRARLDDELLMKHADAVTVCSPALAASRGARRPDVALIPNGVDLTHLTTPQRRPDDLGNGPVAVYVGTLHDERLDVQLACDLADELGDVRFVYVGPDSLKATSRQALSRRVNVRLIGPRPYALIPAYLQHADALIVPHVVSPFTESLDPIKAREYLAVGAPTVATPVAGFRGLGPQVRIATPHEFARELRSVLRFRGAPTPASDLWTWTAAGRAFGEILESLALLPRRASYRGARSS